jgi:carotenoid isomerooxygenase
MRFVMPLKSSREKNENLVKLENTSASAFLVNDKVHCIPEVICDFGCEFPRINYEMCSGVEYKFLYTNARDGGLIKINLETKEKIHWVEDDVVIFDPLFIASPNCSSEDDGIIMSAFFRNSTPNSTGVLILDAKNLEEIARCEFINLPTAIPKPFHTTFVPS